VPLRTGCRLAGAGRQRVCDNSEFRRRVRCEGLGYAVGLHRTTTVWRLDLLGRRIGDPWRSVIWRRHRRGGFRRVTWREGTKGKMSSRFATERVVLAQDDLVDPSQREAVWLLMEWPHARRQRRLYRDHVAGEHVTAPARSESQAAVAHERVYEDAKGELGLDHYEGRSFRAGTTMCPWCWLLRVYRRRALQGFSPSAGKTATRKASHRHDGATATRPSGTSGFLHHCAPGRRARPGHMVTRCPCVTDRDRWDRLVHMPVNTDGRLPFESVVLARP